MILYQKKITRIRGKYRKQYIENVALQYDSIKKIRHDIKNQLLAVYAMLVDGRTDDAMNYISRNVDVITSNCNIVNTDSIIVNAVVNSKFTAAQSAGINVQCSSVKKFVGIDDIDLCNLLGNTLDNAVTACMNVPDNKDKFVSLDISCENNIYRFAVKNSINESVLENNSRLVTSKSDKKHHGFGVKIIRDIAEKYKGYCRFFEENNVFCCLVILKTE